MGDLVEIKTNKYIVSHIFLTHTNFEKVNDDGERGMVTQMSHASLQLEPIMNWTRTTDDVTKKVAAFRLGVEETTVARAKDNAELVSAKITKLKAEEAEKAKTE